MSARSSPHQLTLFAEASRASRSALPESSKASTMSGGSGQNSRESSKKRSRKSSSPKTCQGCAKLDCVQCWPILPTSGSMRNGIVSVPPTSELRTSVTESGLSPTPTASAYGSNKGGSQGRLHAKPRKSLDGLLREGLLPTPTTSMGGGSYGNGSRKLDSLLPTPTVSGDWNRRGASPNSGDGLASVAGASVELREWMLGAPRGWTKI